MTSIIDERGYNQEFVSSPALTARNKRRADAILREISWGPILEIGCGTGEVTNFLSRGTKEKVTAIDISPGFAAEAKHRCGDAVEVIPVSFEDFEPGQKFGAIVGNGILHHFENLDAMLYKINHKKIRLDQRIGSDSLPPANAERRPERQGSSGAGIRKEVWKID